MLSRRVSLLQVFFFFLPFVQLLWRQNCVRPPADAVDGLLVNAKLNWNGRAEDDPISLLRLFHSPAAKLLSCNQTDLLSERKAWITLRPPRSESCSYAVTQRFTPLQMQKVNLKGPRRGLGIFFSTFHVLFFFCCCMISFLLPFYFIYLFPCERNTSKSIFLKLFCALSKYDSTFE